MKVENIGHEICELSQGQAQKIFNSRTYQKWRYSTHLPERRLDQMVAVADLFCRQYDIPLIYLSCERMTRVAQVGKTAMGIS